MLVVLVVCCCLSSIVAGALWGTNVLCDTTNPESQSVGMNCAAVYESSGGSTAPASGGSPAPAPATLTPKQTLLNSGQAIQVAEQTISVATPPTITTQPTGITATGSFTLSIDINMSTLPGQLVRVIGQGVHPSHPGLWLFPAGVAGDVWVRFHIGNSAVDLVTGTAPPVYNTYYNVTIVYNAPSTTATIYYNGVSKSSSTAIVPAGYIPPTPTNFIFNQENVTAPTIKVKNTYWFNKALTAAEVTTLVGTTSTYMPQPLTMGTSAYTKEMYMPY